MPATESLETSADLVLVSAAAIERLAAYGIDIDTVEFVHSCFSRALVLRGKGLAAMHGRRRRAYLEIKFRGRDGGQLARATIKIGTETTHHEMHADDRRGALLALLDSAVEQGVL